ncbi:MarR family winged helix-turn-helix transcriptional regulator [Actinocatenispora sera]|uniref:MarR family transcriptional regulator n=1 Tax=Actinocatenispora sera TaxID=390989 RepID=A0A810L4V9_9ACTN|nr:MarR family winged helix-turn-helix transcriptional regulator [Actinocatenispora sera]BCJ30059.1 MarR family transcriptional regulator [Actinocatenispora sera]
MSISAPSDAEADLLGRTGFRLVELGKVAMAMADAALAEHRLSGRHLRVLTLAAAGVPSQQGMSARSGIDRTTIVSILDDLERAGYVRRRRDPADRRRHLVELTDRGAGALRTAADVLDRAEEDLLGHLSAADRDRLGRTVEKILDGPGAGRALPVVDC